MATNLKKSLILNAKHLHLILTLVLRSLLNKKELTLNYNDMKIALVSNFYDTPHEVDLLNLLFCNGLQIFHLRKDLQFFDPSNQEKYSEMRIRKYIESIPTYFYDRIILHSHFHLIEEYGLRGAHFTKKYTYPQYIADNNLDPNAKHFKHVGFSLHTLEEIKTHVHTYTYLFLSPIFDSISNVGYNSKFSLARLQQFLTHEELSSDIIALGGMHHSKVQKVKELGFDGLALLGHIWSKFEDDADIYTALNRFRKVVELSKLDTPEY